MAHAVYVLVYRGVFLYVRIGLGYIGFGLVVVVVAHEIVNFVVGEKIAQFGVYLRGQGLVVNEYQRGTPGVADNVGYGKGLPASRNSEENLVLAPPLKPFSQGGNGPGLISLGFKGAFEIKQRFPGIHIMDYFNHLLRYPEFFVNRRGCWLKLLT